MFFNITVLMCSSLTMLVTSDLHQIGYKSLKLSKVLLNSD